MLDYRLTTIRVWLVLGLVCVCACWLGPWSLGWCLLPLGLLLRCIQGCCGLDPACVAFEDDFSVDNLATDWDARAGAWNVSGGALSTSSASGLLVATTAMGSSQTSLHATVKFTPASTGDAGRLVFAYTDDSNYWFVEAQAGATNGTFKVFQRSGGTNTQKGTTQTMTGFNATETAIISVCYDSGTVLAVATAGSNTASEVVTATISIGSTKAGVGTGAMSSSAAFDDFQALIHQSENAVCTFCTLPCNICEDTMPQSIEVTLPSNLYTSKDPLEGCVTQACCDSAESQTYVLTLKDAIIANVCSTGSESECYYHHAAEICNQPSCLKWYVQIIAYFDTASGGRLTVVVQNGGGLSGGYIITVASSIVFRLTGIGTAAACSGETFNVPFLTSCALGGCLPPSPPNDVVVAV